MDILDIFVYMNGYIAIIDEFCRRIRQYSSVLLHGPHNNRLITQYKWNNHGSQTSDISYTLAGNKLADHSDVVGASPVGAAPTTSSSST